jgi:hypothetical protein
MSVQTINCRPRATSFTHSDAQAIETSNDQARNFLIHGIDVSGPTTLHGLYVSAQSEAQRAQNAQAREFSRVYVQEHARLSQVDSIVGPVDQRLLCSSVAFIRMFDVAFNHIYSLPPDAKQAFEQNPAILELFHELNEEFPDVNESRRKNQLRNEVIYRHPDRVHCNPSCSRQGCRGTPRSARCTKSHDALDLARHLNDTSVSFVDALARAREFLGDEGTAPCLASVPAYMPSHY